MIQTKRDIPALHFGSWAWGLTVQKLLTVAVRSNRKRGQGSSWTVAPEEEHEECLWYVLRDVMRLLTCLFNDAACH
jgi:hypothetical protein